MFTETRWQAKYIAEFFHFYAGAADKIDGKTLPIDKPDMFVFTDREPVGVVAAIVPWNSQLFLSAVKIGPALAAGNAIVLKASEYGSASMLEFGKLIKQAGIPDGVVNIITGHGDPCGKTLTSHPLVARVSFTGGPASARMLSETPLKILLKFHWNLVANHPLLCLMMPIWKALLMGLLRAFLPAAGQSCVAGSRLYLHESIADEFLRRMVEIATSINIGDPQDESTQMGPLCTPAQIAHIEAQGRGEIRRRTYPHWRSARRRA